MRRTAFLLFAGACLLGAAARPAAAAPLLVAQEDRAQPAPATPPQPALIQQFQKIEDTWSIAMVNKDQYGLENLLNPTFLDISAEAHVNTRNQSIADTLAGVPEPLLSVQQKVVNVRVVSDIAIVEGTYTLRLRESQRTRDERGVFTHVYQRTRGGWSCVSAQRTAVVDELEGTKRRTTAAAPASGSASVADQKKSNAALPFHIPLLYKGAAPAPPPPASQQAPRSGTPAPAPGTIPPEPQDNPPGSAPQ